MSSSSGFPATTNAPALIAASGDRVAYCFLTLLFTHIRDQNTRHTNAAPYIALSFRHVAPLPIAHDSRP